MPEQTIEQTQRQINRLFEEVAQMSEQDGKPATYYAEFLQRVLNGIAAWAGAVWVRTAQGGLQLQYQVNMREIGLDSEAAWQSHDELLVAAMHNAKPLIVPAHSGNTSGPDGKPAPANATGFAILLAPMVVEKQVTGLVEVCQDSRHNPDALPGFLQFVSGMASLAAVHVRNTQMRQMVGQHQLWIQLETFARQIHGTLNPTQIAYLIANEGRRLVECDRLSVAVRHAQKFQIEAISGADVVEKRSSLVQLMRKLTDEVAAWGERLTYTGTHDDTLPPGVLSALDAYLAESASKLLVVLPLKDERDGETKKLARAALIMESFDPPPTAEQHINRLEVVGQHATSALYNAVEYRRIPFRWVWMPIAKVQDGLGGKTRAIIYGIGAAVLLLTLMLLVVPYPLKMDAKGQLLPEERRWVYSPVDGTVIDFAPGLVTGSQLSEGQNLVLMHDVKLDLKIRDLRSEIEGLQKDIASLTSQYSLAMTEQERSKISSERLQRQAQLDRKMGELEAMYQRTNADRNRPGFFWLRSPINGTLLTSDFRETLTNKALKPSEQLVRIGDTEGVWEVELKIPQKHIGQVLKAYQTNNPEEELDVDLLLLAAPTRTFKGKLPRSEIAGEALPNRDDQNESEPIVQAYVRIAGPGIAASDSLVEYEGGRLLKTGTEVHSKIRCGNHAMGYSLFYGVWEFFYEKVVFLF
jgi:hypothetical protein